MPFDKRLTKATTQKAITTADTHIFPRTGIMPYFAFEFKKSKFYKIKKIKERDPNPSFSRSVQGGDVTNV